MDIITLCLLLGVASGVLHPAQGCKILVIYHVKITPSQIVKVFSRLFIRIIISESNSSRPYKRLARTGTAAFQTRLLRMLTKSFSRGGGGQFDHRGPRPAFWDRTNNFYCYYSRYLCAGQHVQWIFGCSVCFEARVHAVVVKYIGYIHRMK